MKTTSKIAVKPPVTFVIPSLTRSGGTRVTVKMANLLLNRGYPVRIAVRQESQHFGQLARSQLRAWYLRLRQREFTSWGGMFEGTIQAYRALGELSFVSGEIVIAVGTYAVADVTMLPDSVTKVRFCHGFATDKPELTRMVWSGPMPTISVSSTLIPQLSEYGAPVVGIVPNGIDIIEYYDLRLPRDGIGMVYGTLFSKAPEVARAVLSAIRARRPRLPFYIFGEPSRPRWLRPRDYTQYPSIERARTLYNRSLIWLLVSRTEGLPAPLVEAMACGTVVIGTDIAGCREVVTPEVNGLLVPFGDVDAYVNAASRLLDDHLMHARLADSGRAFAQSFSWDRALGCMEDVIVRLVTSRGASKP